MTPHDLLAAFDVLAEAPGGIQRLRALVLELAVRGKLVPQDPDDESASALLERIAAEKARLVKAGKIRASKLLPPPSADGVPFELPASWTWNQLGNVLTECMNGISSTPNDDSVGFPLLRISAATSRPDFIVDIHDHRFIDIPRISAERYFLRPGDLLACRFNGNLHFVGRVAIVPNPPPPDMAYPDKLIRLRPIQVAPEYLRHALNARVTRNQIEAMAATTAGNIGINGKQIQSLMVAIPPLAEQHRIVAKVDETMALLDRLGAARNAREDARVALRDAALAALRDAPDAAAVEVAWARVAEHLDDLFTAPADVAPLRQTVLQLAVRGKLVPQDPRDEPASVLLGSRELQLTATEVPFERPAGWAWTCLHALGEFFSGGTPSKSNHGYWDGPIPWVSPKDMKVEWLRDTQDHVSQLALDETTLKPIPKGAVLMVVRGMILAHSFPVACNLVGVTINQDMKALVPFQDGLVTFLLFLLKATRNRILTLVERSTHGTCKMPFQSLARLPLPFPPLAEQGRIVAKVDELMAVCDALEARLRATHDAQAAFAAAAVHHLDT